MESLTAREAADFLGVKVSTLYAYVSRGLIESIAAPDDSRARRYRRSDLERLKRRSDAHSGEGAAASSALDWGAPSIDSRIGQITTSGPVYRGKMATELADGVRPFEEVAELLWTGGWPDSTDWPAAKSTMTPIDEDIEAGSRMVERLRVTAARASLRDLGRFSASHDGRLRCARRIYAEILGAIIRESRTDQDTITGSGVVEALVFAFGLEDTHPVRAALRVGLIVIADHGVNASTFSARVTASTGADLYASVESALATFSGPRHGGAADRCAALVDDMRRQDSVHDALFARVRRGGATPGFGHPLYPEGDPRFRKVCTTLPAVSQAHIEFAADIEDAADALDLGSPTIDLGLAILADAVGMRPAGASTLFAVGRMAGWIAHAIEQLEQGHLLRPRANYLGE